MRGFLGATTITTIYYIARKTVGSGQAKAEIEKLFKLFEIAPIDKLVLENAVKSEITDFEDAVLHEAGRNIGVDAIVTRNPKDFKKGTLPIYSPAIAKKMNKNYFTGDSETNWKRLETMQDKDIDLSDIPEITEDEFKKAKLRFGGKIIKIPYPPPICEAQ